MPRFDVGWIRLDKKIIQGDLFEDPILFATWMWLLLSANYKEGKTKVRRQQVILKPGQVACGVREIAQAINSSKSAVHRWLEYLEKTGRISKESGTLGTIITICKWGEYQIVEENSGTVAGHLAGQSGDNSEQYTNKQVTTHVNGNGVDAPPPEQMGLLPIEPKKEDLHEIAKIWNQLRSVCKVKEMNPKRSKRCKILWRQNPSTEFWINQVKTIEQSQWCNGGGNGTWFANFDFFLRPETQTKIAEGVYSPKKKITRNIIVPEDKPHAL